MSESTIFKAAVKLPPDQRAAYLGKACGSNAELRHEVESLLRAHDASGGFLQDHAGRSRGTADYEPISERPGTVIGPYKLMEQIGEGGFGLVFVAEQLRPVRRKVALKIIKPGMDSREVIARFEAERQALALMDHQNIARVFDAGMTESGRPYFVMELVKGIPIVEYCDQQQLTARERLDLFLSVCQAVQHAHGKGIIHRDLKPSNILVAPHDGVPVVKVIDFGVAKAIGQQLTDKTIYTRFNQMIGTPLYMSPEQAEINALDVDIRSDVYSLGVLLYELLTGTTPFDKKRFATAAYDEIRRIIREEEPPKPSTRLSTLGEALSKVSVHRKTEPAKLSALVKGDLDWIVMKALEKDRRRRYETANAFAADVRRFLNEQPIEARPPSALYRFRKLARRNKVALTTATIVALSLVAGTVVSTWQAVRATRAGEVALLNEEMAQDQKRAADAAKEKAEKRSDELAALSEKLRRFNYVADMNLAGHAWEENNLSLIRELSNRYLPKAGETDLRGFEWHYVRRLLHRDLFTLNAHVGEATTVAWTPDGKRLISCGLTKAEVFGGPNLPTPREIKLWDVATRELLPLPLALKAVPDIAKDDFYVSRDCKLLAAACRDKMVRVWNIETGELKATLSGHTVEIIFEVVFSPDGKYLASRGFPKSDDDARTLGLLKPLGELRIWDLDTHKAVLAINELPHGGHAAFSPDGKRLVYTTEWNALKVWDLSLGTDALEKKWEDPVDVFAFSPDGKRLAVGRKAGDVQILDGGTLELVRSCPGYGPVRSTLTFSPDGKLLAVAGNDMPVELWDVESGRLVHTLKGHSGRVYDVVFSPDSRRLATADQDGCLKVWDAISDPCTISITATGPNSHDVELSPGPNSHDMVLSPDGRIALTGLFEKTLQMWDADTGKPLGEPLKLDHKQVNHDFTADGKRVVLTDAGRNVTIFDVATCKRIRTFMHDGPEGEPVGTILSPDGKWFVCDGPGGVLKAWDVEKGVGCATFKGLKNYLHFWLSPDGTRLAASDTTGAIMIWDRATGRELCAAKLQDVRINGLCFSPDGKRLAAACQLSANNFEVRILDAENGHEVFPRFKGAKASRFAFSPDGKRLATWIYDGMTVKLWDLTTGQATLTLNGHTGAVTDLWFSPDGHRLIGAFSDRTVRIWDARPLPE